MRALQVEIPETKKTKTYVRKGSKYRVFNSRASSTCWRSLSHCLDSLFLAATTWCIHVGSFFEFGCSITH